MLYSKRLYKPFKKEVIHKNSKARVIKHMPKYT